MNQEPRYSEVPGGLRLWQSKYSAGVNGSPATLKQMHLNLLRPEFMFYLTEISVHTGGVSWRVMKKTNKKQKHNWQTRTTALLCPGRLGVDHHEQGPKHQQVDWTLGSYPASPPSLIQEADRPWDVSSEGKIGPHSVQNWLPGERKA